MIGFVDHTGSDSPSGPDPDGKSSFRSLHNFSRSSYTMNSPAKPKSQLMQVVMLIAIGLFSFYTASRSSRFHQLHGADVVLLLATGLCFGVAFSLLFVLRKNK